MSSEPMILYCPKCEKQHIDKGEWETKLHRTHLCEYCAHEWQPSAKYTVGVEDMGEIVSHFTLAEDQNAIVFDRDGNLVEAVIAASDEDDIATRGNMLVAALVGAPREDLDALIEKVLGHEPEKAASS